MCVCAVEERPLDYVCGTHEIEQTAENLAIADEHGDDEDFSTSLPEEGQSDSDISSDDGDDVTLSRRGRKRKAKRMDGFLNDEELGDELPLSVRRAARKAANEEEDDDFADRLLVSARKRASETRRIDNTQDELVREKVKSAFQQGLDMASNELQDDGKEYKPSLVSSAVEEALFRLYGGTTKDYKTKMRSLHFNLKDPNNKELRAHVLRGDISPDNFVRMTANELASKELAEYRKRKEEEALKMSVLDAEAAAKFSTAAALEVKGEKSKTTKLTEIPEDEHPVAVSENGERGDGAEKSDEEKLEPSPVKERHVETQGKMLEEEDKDPDTARAPSGLDWASIKSASMQAAKEQPNYIAEFSNLEPIEEPQAMNECDENLKKLFLPCPEPLALGLDKWKGTVSVPGLGNCTMSGSSLSGCGDLEVLLGKGLSAKGRLALENLEKFLSELHLSKHRTATVGILKASSDDKNNNEESVSSQTLVSHYKEKDRAGVAKSTSGVEVYLIPRCPLATKLLQVAQNLEPDVFQECITKQGIDVADDTEMDVFIAVAVHKKDMVARPKNIPPPPPALPAGLDLNAISALAEAIGVVQSNPPPPPVPMVSTSLPPDLDLSGISALAQAFGVSESTNPMNTSSQLPMTSLRPAPMTSSKPLPMKKTGQDIPNPMRK